MAEQQMSLIAPPAAVADATPDLPPAPSVGEVQGKEMLREWADAKGCAFNLRNWVLFQDESGATVFAVLFLQQRTTDGVLRFGIPALEGVVFEGRNVSEVRRQAFVAMEDFARAQGVTYVASVITCAGINERRYCVKGPLGAES